MPLLRYLKFTVLVFIGLACTSTGQLDRQEQSSTAASFDETVPALVGQLPAKNQDKSRWVFSRLISADTPDLFRLTNMLVAPGSGDDTQIRYAVNGLTKYVSRSGAESERRKYEMVLLESLQTHLHPEVKSFLMEQMEIIGSDRSVPVVAGFLENDDLYKSAIHVLRSINTQEARQALVKALSSAQGNNQLAIIKTLGDMKVHSVATEFIPFADSNDWGIRKASLYALAQTGNPVAIEPLTAAINKHEGYKKEVIENYNVLLAKRLKEEGNKEESIALSRQLMSGEYGSHITSAALDILFDNAGAGAREELLEAATSDDQHLRYAALSILKEHPELEIPQQWTNQFDGYAPEVQADIIALLGSDRASVSMLMPYVQSRHPAVRAAAAQAVASLGGEEALSGLLDALLQTESPDDRTVLKDALLRISTDKLVKGVTKALPSASASAKVPLIKILGQRRAVNNLDSVVEELENSEPKVRLAVFEAVEGLVSDQNISQIVSLLAKAKTSDERNTLVESISNNIGQSNQKDARIIEAIAALPPDQKGWAMSMLPKIGSESALDAVMDARASDSEALRRKADRALASWPNAAAIAPLWEVLQQNPEDDRDRLLQSYIRLVNQSNYSSEEKARYLERALGITSFPQEKILLLKGLCDQATTEALKKVKPYFEGNNEQIREQSFRAAAQILAESDADTPQQFSLLDALTDENISQHIEQYLQQDGAEQQETDHFTSLFNGKDLSGWTGDTDSYKVEEGTIISKEGAAGNLFTEEEYSNFILQFEFKLTEGANNGIGIRAPLEGNPAYDAMEIQVLDNAADKYADLETWQYHGSVYGVVPAERGALNPVGEWNTQEIIADGSKITVKVNGETIVETDLQESGQPETIDGENHPGLFRERGHIGFLGHGDKVSFRHIRIRDLDVYYPDYNTGSAAQDEDMNKPPEGFTALFNGENLEGWKGLVGNPESRSEMSAQELSQKQKKANTDMRRHWSVREGILIFDGEGESLATEKEYQDFEMMVDWKIESGGDSGIYLRGTPQVQIWDITEHPEGSGGLYNNQQHSSRPLVAADHAIGEWNKMRVKMVGEKVTVHLNDQLVVDDVVMENYWDRDQPIYPAGQIELQSHSTPLYFKNIFIREIPRSQKLFNGQDLTGWTRVGGEAGGWHADGGILYTKGGGEKWKKGVGGGWLSTTETYDDFKLQLEYRLPEGGNSGVFLRAPHEGDPAYKGMEIQLLDDDAEQYAELEPWQYTGSIYDVKAPSQRASKEAGQWQKMGITLDGPKIKVRLNGQVVINTTLVHFMDRAEEHPGLKRRSGYIGLQNHNSRVEFRNITVKEIN